MPNLYVCDFRRIKDVNSTLALSTSSSDWRPILSYRFSFTMSLNDSQFVFLFYSIARFSDCITVVLMLSIIGVWSDGSSRHGFTTQESRDNPFILKKSMIYGRRFVSEGQCVGSAVERVFKLRLSRLFFACPASCSDKSGFPVDMFSIPNSCNKSPAKRVKIFMK